MESGKKMQVIIECTHLRSLRRVKSQKKKTATEDALIMIVCKRNLMKENKNIKITRSKQEAENN